MNFNWYSNQQYSHTSLLINIVLYKNTLQCYMRLIFLFSSLGNIILVFWGDEILNEKLFQLSCIHNC